MENLGVKEIILICTLIPFVLGIFSRQVWASKFYALLILVAIIIFIPLHALLPAQGLIQSSDTEYSEANNKISITHLKWRLTKWGILHGDKTDPKIRNYLVNQYSISASSAKMLDYTNPTPALLLIWLTVLSVLSALVDSLFAPFKDGLYKLKRSELINMASDLGIPFTSFRTKGSLVRFIQGGKPLFRFPRNLTKSKQKVKTTPQTPKPGSSGARRYPNPAMSLCFTCSCGTEVLVDCLALDENRGTDVR